MQRELCGMKFKKRLRFRSPLSIGLSGTVQPLPARAYGVVQLSAPVFRGYSIYPSPFPSFCSPKPRNLDSSY